MKFILVAALLLQLLFVAETFAQNELREKLKGLENNDFLLVSKTKKASEELEIGSYLDSLISFVASQKGICDASFEKNIKPYLDERLIGYTMLPIEFSDDEEMIYESFVKTLKWENAIESVQLYEDFIVNYFKDSLQVQSVLLVLSYIRSVHSYLNTKSDQAVNSFVRNKLKEEFQSYNAVGWNVFALHPGAMIFWLAATWVWEYKEN